LSPKLKYSVIFANFFLSLVGALASFFGLSLAKKTMFATAAVAASLALTAAFILVIKGLTVGIVATLPAWAQTGAGLFIPGNTAACIGALISARVGRWIYDYHMETLKLVSYIT